MARVANVTINPEDCERGTRLYELALVALRAGAPLVLLVEAAGYRSAGRTTGLPASSYPPGGDWWIDALRFQAPYDDVEVPDDAHEQLGIDYLRREWFNQTQEA